MADAHTLWIVQSPEGTLWKDTLSLEERTSRNLFVRSIYGHLFSLGEHTCWQVWEDARRGGWKLIHLELSEMAIAALAKAKA